MTRKKQRKWPLLVIGSSAAVAVWSGWVGLGDLSGFGVVHPLPGIWDSLQINTAITLPIGVEAYGAYAMGAWLDTETPATVRKFAKRSSIGAISLGALGQIAYHLLNAFHRTAAPWEIVTAVSCLPVVTLGFAAALHHLRHVPEPESPPPAAPDIPTTFQPSPLQPFTPQSPPPPTPVPPSAPEAKTADSGPAGTISVRSPLSRSERKIPVDERVAARMTGSFPAIQ